MRRTLDKTVAITLALQERELTTHQIAREFGLSSGSAAAMVGALRRDKRIHRAGWAKDAAGRLFVPTYRWGEGDDAPRPGRSRSPAQHMRLLRAQRKAGAKLDEAMTTLARVALSENPDLMAAAATVAEVVKTLKTVILEEK